MKNKPLTKSEIEVKTTLENLIKLLGVNSATVELEEGEHNLNVFEVHTKLAEDRGKIIGRNGQNVRALITIVNAYAKQRGVAFSNIHLNDD